MSEERIVTLWRKCIRLLRTDKERLGGAERWVRASLLIVLFLPGYLLLYIRAALWRPLTVEGISEDGIRLRCRLPDVIQMYVYLFGTWEPDLAAFIHRRLRPGDTFIDVGANIGYLSALGSRVVGRDGTVVAIEPAPFAQAALQETAALNDLHNIRLVGAAVSDENGSLPLFAGPNYGSEVTTTVARRGWIDWFGARVLGLRERGEVQAATLGSLLTPEELASARLIKIDVEGAEDRVLAGMLDCVDALPSDVEVVVEVRPLLSRNPQLRPIDLLRPFLDRGFHAYMLSCTYSPWRYLWPSDVSVPQRIRDPKILERRAGLDVVLSRTDADEL